MPNRILVVTPFTEVRRLLNRFLVHWGYDVTGVESMSDALKQLELGTFSAVMTGVELLRDGDGFDLLRHVNQQSSTSVIAIGMKLAGTAMYERAISAGFAAALPMPFMPDALQSAIERVCSQVHPVSRASSCSS